MHKNCFDFVAVTARMLGNCLKYFRYGGEFSTACIHHGSSFSHELFFFLGM